MTVFDSRSGIEALGPPPVWVCALLGIILIAAGAAALGDVVFATIVSVKFIGLTAIAAGAFEIAHAFWTKGWGGFLWQIVLGALYLAFGLVLLAQPASGALILTYVLERGAVRIGHHPMHSELCLLGAERLDHADFWRLRGPRGRADPVPFPHDQRLGARLPARCRLDRAWPGMAALRAAIGAQDSMTMTHDNEGESDERSNPTRFPWPCTECRCRRGDRRRRCPPRWRRGGDADRL